ncbi:MAG TPA: hypothetical protein PL056_01810 [bacterium]|nr:hypothetical protein [bacterium]
MESVSRNEKIVHLLKKCGVSIRPENEFESIYAHTLVKYSVECKNKNFADFFAKKEIWEAFRMKFSSNYDEFEDRINTYLNIGDDRFMKIRSDGYRNVDDLKIEIERFSKIFDETIKEAMKPSEVKLQDSQDLISKKLDSVMDLLQVKNNIDISGEFLKKSKELLDQKEYDKARIWLEEFNKTHLDSNEKKWKYFNNLGVAYIGVGNQEKAADYLIEALKYNPDNQNALENAAFGYHIKNDNKKVQELAKKLTEIDKSSIIANQLMILSCDTLKEAEDYFETIPLEIRHKDHVASAIAFKYYQDNDFENALKWYDIAIKERPQDRELIYLYAVAMASKINKKVHSNISLSEEDLNKGREIAEKIKKFWNEIPTKEEKINRIDWAVNGATLLADLGEFEESLTLLKEAENLIPNDFYIIRNLAVIYHKTGQTYKALEYFEKLLQKEKTPENIILYSNLIYNERIVEKFPTTIELLSELIEHIESDKQSKEKSISFKTIILCDLNKFNEAFEFIDKYLKEDPSNPYHLLTMGIYHLKNKNYEKAAEFFEEAKSNISSNNDYFLRKMVAERLFNLNHFKSASEVYESLIKKPYVYDELTFRYITSLYYSDKKKELLEICKELRDQHEIDEKITPFEINILEIKGDIKEAYNISELYLKKFDNIHERIRNAMILWRFNEDATNDKLDGFLLDFDLVKIKDQPIELWKKLSFLFDKRSLFNSDIRRKYLDFTYEMRRNFYNDIETHKLYYFNFITKFQDLIKKVETIENNCHVQIEIEGSGKFDFIIDDRPDVSVDRKEKMPDDPIVQKVLGQKNGFEYTYRESPFGNNVAKIVGFESKYVFALRDALKIIEHAPDARGFYKIKIPENEKGELDVPAFFKMLENGNKGWKKISEETKDFYTSRRIPLSFYAKAEQKNIIEAWLKVTKDKALGVFSTTGIAKNVYPVLKKLLFRAEDQPIVIDLISIMTLIAIDDENIISDSYGPFLIPQSSLDVINMISTQIPNTQKTLDLANKIKEWIKNNCRIENPSTAIKELEEPMGKEFSDPPSLAKEKAAFYYSDDTIQRSFSETNGVWTELMLMDLLYKGKIDEKKHKDMMVKLAEMYYYRTVVNAEILIYAVQKADGNINSTIEKLFHYFSANIYDEDFSILTGTDFLIELLQQNFLSDFKKQTIINVFFSAFFENRMGRKMAVSKFEATIKNKFQYDPLKRDYLIGMLFDWERIHLAV